jgi:hypothetical protein
MRIQTGPRTIIMEVNGDNDLHQGFLYASSSVNKFQLLMVLLWSLQGVRLLEIRTEESSTLSIRK